MSLISLLLSPPVAVWSFGISEPINAEHWHRHRHRHRHRMLRSLSILLTCCYAPAPATAPAAAPVSTPARASDLLMPANVFKYIYTRRFIWPTQMPHTHKHTHAQKRQSTCIACPLLLLAAASATCSGVELHTTKASLPRLLPARCFPQTYSCPMCPCVPYMNCVAKVGLLICKLKI